MISPEITPPMQDSPPTRPTRAGARPHGRRGAALAIAPLGLAVMIGACAQGNANTDPPVVLGLTSSAPAYYSDAELTLYEAQAQVPLQVRRPTSAEESALGKSPPFPHAPFLQASDLTIEIHYTLSNLDAKDHTVELLLDPWNEFVRWEPGVTVIDDDDTEPNFSGYDDYLIVPAKSRVEGTITSDDVYNLEANLATVENILANPPANLSVSLTAMCNHIFNLQHRSNDGDPLVTPFIPKVTPGLTGFDLGVRTSEPANVAIEVVLDVTDNNGDRLLPSGSTSKPIGRPGTVLSPPGARQGN
jgi:hypothetical protein